MDIRKQLYNLKDDFISIDEFDLIYTDIDSKEFRKYIFDSCLNSAWNIVLKRKLCSKENKHLLFNDNVIKAITEIVDILDSDLPLDNFLIHSQRIATKFVKSPSDLFLVYLAGQFYIFAYKVKFIRTLNDRNLNQFSDFINYSIKNNFYKSVLKDVFYDQELNFIHSLIKNKTDPFVDAAGGAQIGKLTLPLKDSSGDFVESLKYIYLLTALILVALDKNYLLFKYDNSDYESLNCSKYFKKELCFKVVELYDALSTKILNLSTPTLLGLRFSKSKCYSSCYVMKLEDNCESILYGIFSSGLISKHNGGIGVNFSSLRARGSNVANFKGVSKGVLSYVKLFNACSESFAQGGQRSSAITVALDCWHKDIFLFLEMGSEVGDQRLRCHDVFPQIVIVDEFMHRVRNNDDWLLFCPYEIKSVFNIDIDNLYGERFTNFYKKLEEYIKHDNLKKIEISFIRIKARDLFKKIVDRQVETGLPFIFFKCNANRKNPNKHIGYIPSGNLCMESFSNFNKLIQNSNSEIHCCNLASIDLSQAFCDEDLKYIVDLGVKVLNIVLSANDSPLEPTSRHNSIYRTIGLGTIGLQDFLVYRSIKYSDYLLKSSNLYELIALNAVNTSANLAEILGSYPAFKNSNWDKGVLFGRNFNEYVDCFYLDEWKKVLLKIKKNGVANGQLLALAPNSNTAISAAASASFLPLYSTFFKEHNSKCILPVIAKFILEKDKFYEVSDIIDKSTLIDICANISSWVDQGTSFELLYQFHQIKMSDLLEHYIRIWGKGIKTIYYIRSKSDSSRKELECESCVL